LPMASAVLPFTDEDQDEAQGEATEKVVVVPHSASMGIMQQATEQTPRVEVTI